ncbi:TonB-dependent receptor [Hallella mizrahii]|uniref:TonB-dependent receptor plug domain-containing protein n=1 Tax=Hallella mizrahii TaxID=2606637 RepID=A0A7K0KF47_9BACT|nr:TonB-dependent receptor [Hallella mizrahii]MST84085.1 TonB-dependent receptor plug domain-containing protein [Hallella mizrahii]
MDNKLLLLAALLGAANLSYAQTDSVRLSDVVVTGTRYRSDIRHLPLDVSVINRSKLTATYQPSVLPTLSQQVPGLFVTTRGILGYGLSTGAAGTIKMRGVGGSADLLVLIDGLPQYAGLYGHPLADTYQTMMADRVEVVGGPVSTIYGSNAMGGVVNIVTRQMRENGVRTNVNLQGGSYGTFIGTATNRLRQGRFSSIAALNYERTDGHRANSAFSQTSGFLKLGYDLSRYWQINGTANIAYQESSNLGPVSAPLIDNDMLITRGMTALSLTNDYSRMSGAVRAFYNWGHHHINDGHVATRPAQTVYYMHNDRMGGVSAYESFAPFSTTRVTLGFDYQHFGGHAWQKAMADGSRTDLANRTVNEVAGYADIRQELLSWLTADVALRLDHHSVSGSEWIPQGGLTARLPYNMELKAIVGKGFRNPTLRELYMFRPANADLAPERLWNYEFSLRQRLLDGHLGYGLNVFYLNAEDLITTQMVNGRPLNVNTGSTENSGFELLAFYVPMRHLRLDANYSFLHTSRTLTAAPKHKLFMGADWQPGRFTLHSGLQWIDGLHTADNSPKTENFWLWDLTASLRVSRALKFFVHGENLLAQHYEVNAGFPMPRATVMAGVEVQL